MSESGHSACSAAPGPPRTPDNDPPAGCPANTGPHPPPTRCEQDTGSCSSEDPPTSGTNARVCVRYYPCIKRYAPICQPSRVADGDRERTGSGYVRSAAVHAGVPGHPAADAGDCTQATKRQAPRRTVMITADCVPYLFRQMGARPGNGPGRRIQRGRSGRYHCSSGPCWPVMTREDPGERAVPRTVHFQRHG